jgi:hypothetical protein
VTQTRADLVDQLRGRLSEWIRENAPRDEEARNRNPRKSTLEDRFHRHKVSASGEHVIEDPIHLGTGLTRVSSIS